MKVGQGGMQAFLSRFSHHDLCSHAKAISLQKIGFGKTARLAKSFCSTIFCKVYLFVTVTPPFYAIELVLT